MIDQLTFRRALGDRIGQVLTPALCSEIEVAASRPADHSIQLEQFVPRAVGDYLLKVERFRAVLPELRPLHEAHWLETEAHRHGFELAPDYDAMASNELQGRLLQFTVRHAPSGELVGNLRMYVLPSLHTRNLLAREDTLYIAPAHRGGLLGLKLVAYAEDCLRQIGVREITADSKLMNRAGVLMRRRGFREIATVFYKILED